MMNKIMIVALGAVLATGSVAGASAKTWGQTHPRRVEVNKRLANQNKRIDTDLASGKITGQQATQLHQDDSNIRASERTDASLDDSHLTKAGQTSLNQDENAVSQDIHKDAQ